MIKNKMTKKQLEIIRDLEGLISKYKLQKKFSSEMVIDWIWRAEGESAMEATNAYQKKCFDLFPKIKDLGELNRVLQILTEAWNYFPHQALGGKSPSQRFKEVYGTEPEAKRQQETKNDPLPKVICGGHEFSWDEYWAMIKQGEREQEPFRDWIKKRILPAYVKYLKKQFKDKKTAKDHEMVVEIFFDRAWHLGFVTFEQIRAQFIWQDFPAWWQTHVMGDKQTEDQIRSSLIIFSNFLSDECMRELPIK